MKSIKLAAVLFAACFYTGTSSALSVTLDDILTLGDGPFSPSGLEIDDYANAISVGTANSPYAVGSDDGTLDGDHASNGGSILPGNDVFDSAEDVDGNTILDDGTFADWIGLDVVTAGVFSLVTTSWDALGGATGTLSVLIYSADPSFDTTGPAFAGSTGAPLTVGLAAGKYVAQLYGDISVVASPNVPATYTMEVTSIVPVPAAVWLFGTALLGVFGLRRKAKVSAAAA